jgi:hypothetical protein
LTQPFPGFDHFYSLSDPLKDSAYRGVIDVDDALSLTRGTISVTEPVSVRWKMGRTKPLDVVWTTMRFPLIVNSRVVELLADRGITGWSDYKVTLVEKSGEVRTDFVGLQIHGRCGPINLNDSTVVLKEYPVGWLPELQGHYFDEESWDGSDIFMHAPDQTGKEVGHILVSRKVKDLFEEANVENVVLTPVPDVTVSLSIYKIGMPHLLPIDLSQRIDRAYQTSGCTRPAGF